MRPTYLAIAVGIGIVLAFGPVPPSWLMAFTPKLPLIVWPVAVFVLVGWLHIYGDEWPFHKRFAWVLMVCAVAYIGAAMVGYKGFH